MPTFHPRTTAVLNAHLHYLQHHHHLHDCLNHRHFCLCMAFQGSAALHHHCHRCRHHHHHLTCHHHSNSSSTIRKGLTTSTMKMNIGMHVVSTCLYMFRCSAGLNSLENSRLVKSRDPLANYLLMFPILPTLIINYYEAL